MSLEETTEYELRWVYVQGICLYLLFQLFINSIVMSITILIFIPLEDMSC